MRLIFAAAVAIAIATPALAQNTAVHVRLPPPTLQAEQKVAAAQARFGPQSRAFAVTEGKRLAAGASVDEASLRASIVRANVGATSEGDVMMLAQLVMMQASQDAAYELRDLIAEVKAANEAKGGKRPRTTPMGLAPGGTKPVPMPSSQAPTPHAFKTGRPPLNQQFADLAREKDGLSDLSQEQSLKLQMYQDRYGKLMEMLSNIMKKQSDTQASIVSNLK
jgi:hypothetical protein